MHLLHYGWVFLFSFLKRSLFLLHMFLCSCVYKTLRFRVEFARVVAFVFKKHCYQSSMHKRIQSQHMEEFLITKARACLWNGGAKYILIFLFALDLSQDGPSWSYYTNVKALRVILQLPITCPKCFLEYKLDIVFYQSSCFFYFLWKVFVQVAIMVPMK